MTSTDISAEHKEALTDALDEIMDEYQADNKIIFASESERADQHFGFVGKGLRDWKRSKQCLVPECLERSIARSHAIPKGMSLATISEDGHLLTPDFDQRIGELGMKSIGISLASTFPGFCSEHELLFEEFETQKKIETEAHIYLQTYRAACRELFRLKFHIKQNEWLTSSYCRQRDEQLMALVKQRAIDKGFPSDAKFSSIAFSSDPLVDRTNDFTSKLQNLSSHIEEKIISALQKTIFDGCEKKTFVNAIEIDLQFPVALSGCSSFFLKADDEKKEVYLIMSVLPCADRSILIFSGDIDNKKYIELYITKWTTNAFSMLSMIETWMVNGTDQWYLKPSIWKTLTDSRQSSILSDILSCQQNIGEEYGISIFDELRTAFLLTLKENEEPTQDAKYWRLVGNQEGKMK